MAESDGGVASGVETAVTGLLYDLEFLEHELQPGHPESPERLRRALNALQAQGLRQACAPLAPLAGDMEEQLLYVHTPEHIADLRRLKPNSERIARKVVAGVLSATEAVCEGRIANAFCLTRPPGHHALNTGREEGFCFYNGVAIGAIHAQRRYGLERILVIDWDYHHGNSTEAFFYSDPTVLFFSSHNYFDYPGTGDPNRRGAGAGVGFNINVHLDCGTTDGQIVEAYESLLVPAAETFKPDMIFISAGFDSRRRDLLGCFDVSDEGFARLTQLARGLADTFCDGRIVSVLEGGYEVNGTASAICAHVGVLLS
ncbi:MAG: histone deacetylase family protein [Candidatus Eutrophobiaceae bacterium]